MNQILPEVKLANCDIDFILCEIKANIQKRKIVNFLAHQNDKEIQEIVKYLKKNRISAFPYSFTKKYNISDLSVKKDSSCGMYYIPYGSSNIYMKRSYTTKFRAARYFNSVRLEQDNNSPHKYVTDSFHPDKDSIILDIGGAEGFFSLDYINIAKKIFIFEYSEEWVEALEKTYANYKDKVVIIKKFVDSYSDAFHISLDDFIEYHQLQNEKLFIKIDAEGSEPSIIRGGNKLFHSQQSIQLALCTYHCAHHEQLFKELFKGWHIEPSEGYMLYYYDFNFKEPYTRRGLLRIRKE